jgi:hypothetical protein
LLGLKPDVWILRREDRQVVFVETKTIGASIARNHLLYLRVLSHLRDVGWSAELYYLLSHGHECQADWPLIEQSGLAVILWEDVLRTTLGTPFETLFDEDLSIYATAPTPFAATQP